MARATEPSIDGELLRLLVEDAGLGVLALDHQGAQRFISRGLGILEREREAKRRVRVHAGADGIGLQRQERMERRDHRFRQRLQVGGPAPSLRRIPPAQLGRELEEPRPAVGALEAAAARLAPVSHFGGDVPGGEALVERRTDLRQGECFQFCNVSPAG